MQEADQILIPLLDGRHALAQVARVEGDRGLLFVTDRVADAHTPITPLPEAAIVASAVVKLSEVAPDQWHVIGYDAVPRITQFSTLSLPEAQPTDPAVVEALVNALFGLYPWDGFPDPGFFNAFLRSPETTPKSARLTAEFPTPEA